MWLSGDVVTYSTGQTQIGIVGRDSIPLAGAHNVHNVMAALLAAVAAGMPADALAGAVRDFRPMTHRLQCVQERDGVLFVDDSKATNPGAAIAALHAYDRPIVLIAGGKSKNTDFVELGRAVDARAKAVVLIGEAADELSMRIANVPKVRADSMPHAVRAARALAVPGDIVLLSPACASFDMFRSAEDRGERFAAAVRALEVPANA